MPLYPCILKWVSVSRSCPGPGPAPVPMPVPLLLLETPPFSQCVVSPEDSGSIFSRRNASFIVTPALTPAPAPGCPDSPGSVLFLRPVTLSSASHIVRLCPACGPHMNMSTRFPGVCSESSFVFCAIPSFFLFFILWRSCFSITAYSVRMNCDFN